MKRVINILVESVFRDCSFEITRAKMRCTSKIKLASLAHERERFFAEVSANRLLRYSYFFWKFVCYTVLQSL